MPKLDLVCAIDIIEHIENHLLFLKNMNRHLKKGGLLIINTQNALSLNYLIQGVPRRLRGDKKWMGWDPTHVRFYTPKSLRENWETPVLKLINGLETTIFLIYSLKEYSERRWEIKFLTLHYRNIKFT